MEYRGYLPFREEEFENKEKAVGVMMKKDTREEDPIARRYFINGRVQGVGYRWFTVRAAEESGLRGWVRNLADGGVEAYAIGGAAQLSDFEGRLHLGPLHSDVRQVRVEEAALDVRLEGFQIR